MVRLRVFSREVTRFLGWLILIAFEKSGAYAPYILLTLVFIPTLYALLFKINPVPRTITQA